MSEEFNTHPDYTLPLAEPMPKFSMKPENMGGVTHQQWLNSYLERRSAYIEEVTAEGKIPTVMEFHARLVDDIISVKPTYTAWLGKVSGAVQRITDPGVKRTAKESLTATAPSLLTEHGAIRVIEELRDSQRRIPSVANRREEAAKRKAGKRHSQLVGNFIVQGGYMILDPETGVVIDPRTITEL